MFRYMFRYLDVQICRYSDIRTAGIAGIAKATGIRTAGTAVTTKNAGIRTVGTAIVKSWNRHA